MKILLLVQKFLLQDHFTDRRQLTNTLIEQITVIIMVKNEVHYRDISKLISLFGLSGFQSKDQVQNFSIY